MADTSPRSSDPRYGSIEEEIAKLRSDVANLTASLRHIAKDAAGIAADNVRDQVDKAAAEAKAALNSTQKTVGEHPFTTIALAVGLGFLLGQWMRR